MNLSELTVDQLIERLQAAHRELSHSLLEACQILTELRKRGHSRPEWRSGVFQWCDHIVRGELDPFAALTMYDSPFIINNIVGLPLEEQRRLAAGGEITVAVLQTDGTVVAESQSIATIQPSAFARVIDRGVIRTFDAQKRILLDRTYVKRAHRSSTLAIRVDKLKEEVIIGAVRVGVDELASALYQLGFKVERFSPSKENQAA